MEILLGLIAYLVAAAAILALCTLTVRFSVVLIHAYMQREREVKALRDAREFVQENFGG